MKISLLSLGLLSVPSAVAQLGQLTHLWRVPGSYPEGVAYDKANKRILLTSLISNSIVSLDTEDGMNHMTTYIPENEDNQSALGLRVDEETGHVHVVIATFELFDNGGVAVYDLPMSEEKEAAATVAMSLDFPCTDGNSSCGLANQVTIVGDVTYATDSMLGRIFKVEDGVMEEVSSDPLLMWVDESFPFGINGIVHVGGKNDGFLIGCNTGAGSLVKVNLNNNEVTEIDIIGEAGGGDGLLFSKESGRLYMTATTTVVVFESDDNWLTANVIGNIDIDQSDNGESATTMAFGESKQYGGKMLEEEIYVTYVRFNDLFGAGINEEPSLLGKITLMWDEKEVNPPKSTVSSSKSSKSTRRSKAKKKSKSGKKM